MEKKEVKNLENKKISTSKMVNLFWNKKKNRNENKKSII